MTAVPSAKTVNPVILGQPASDTAIVDDDSEGAGVVASASKGAPSVATQRMLAIAAARRLAPSATPQDLFAQAATAAYRDDHIFLAEQKLLILFQSR